VQHAGLVQARQLGHVFALVELGRIHLLYDIFVDEHTLAGLSDFHLDLIASLAFDAGRHEALAVVGHPHQTFLGPFRLCGLIVELIPVDGQVFHERVRSVGVHVHGYGGSAHSRTSSTGAMDEIDIGVLCLKKKTKTGGKM